MKWSLQTGKWSLEAGKWKLEVAKRISEGENSFPSGRYLVPSRPVSGDLRAESPDPRGDPSLKYIRSGPEGARGVLDVRGWSLCMFLSELLSFRLSSFCCLSVGRLLLLPEPGVSPGSPGVPGPDLCFSTFFLNRIFDGFLMVLASNVDDLFDDFPMFFA